MTKKTLATPGASIADALEIAVAKKTELARLDDEVSAKIREVEAGLRALKFGVALKYVVSRTPSETTSYDVVELCFRKHDGEWALVRDEYIEGMEGEETTPLLNCPRDFRTAALATYLPGMVRNFAAAMDERISKRKEALDSGQELITALAAVAARSQG